jgi:nicotinate-nucleotide adenylyltransferase
MQVALFGGSFNPPHVAHILGAAYLLSVPAFDRVLVVPVYEHAFDKSLAPFDDRVEMCRLALSWLPGVEVSRVEERLARPSRTLNTVEHLLQAHPDWQLRLVVGADVLAEVDKWYRFEDVQRLAPVYALGRAGGEVPGPRPVLPDVSSTEVRRLLASADPDDARTLDALLPRAVHDYILRRGLYR